MPVLHRPMRGSLPASAWRLMLGPPRVLKQKLSVLLDRRAASLPDAGQSVSLQVSRCARVLGSNTCWLQKKQLTLKSSLQLVQKARPSANPNAGFMTQLLRLEQKLHGRKTVKVSC